MKKRINITIEDHVLNMVDELAEARGIDRSTMFSILAYDAANMIDSREKNDPLEGLIRDLGEVY